MDNDLKELQIQIISEISQILGQPLNLDQVLEAILGVLSRSPSLKQASIMLQDPGSGQFRCRASRPRTGCPAAEGLTGLVLRTSQPFILPLLSQDPVFLNQAHPRPLHKEQISLIGVPLVFHGSTFGVLSVDRLFGEEIAVEEDLRFLSIIAGLVAPRLASENQEKRPEGLRLETLSLPLELAENSRTSLIVGQSPAILEVQQLLKKVAPGRAPVLLIGESGTGKSLMARVIHEQSPRARYPFLKINCASMPENLLAAELFGFEKDAIPGALKARPGRLEEADRGTLFLEEIGELPLNLQDRLVRFLQEMEFRRLGSSRPRKVDVRLLADTFQDLRVAVKSGSFREDLYYLLSHGAVRVPPLRERPQDIPLLLDHFLDKVSKEYGRRFYLTQRALEALEDYAWPGNVREMENLVERLCLVVDSAEISVKDLPPYLSPAKSGQSDQAFLTRLKEMEKREILAALERNRWIQSQAAMELGLTLRQIGYRVKQFGLEKLVKEHRGQARSV